MLDQFPDTKYLTGDTAEAAAALVEAGLVTGSEGELQMDRPLTRAEFVTILYRLADQYLPASSYTGQTDTGAVLSGDTALADLTAGDLWLDHKMCIRDRPLAASFCNGTTSTCDGLSQWGSEHLAQEGYNSVEILQHYYGENLEIVNNAPI